MRELTNDEIKSVSGGYVGTKIPFFNGFIPGANWPGGAPGALERLPGKSAPASAVQSIYSIYGSQV